MEDVKTSFNIWDGIVLRLGEGSKVTLNKVEGSYNGYDGYGGGGVNAAASPNSQAELILKGTNSFIGNTGSLDTYGLYAEDNINVVVSRGATLNAYNNTGVGVWFYVGSLVHGPSTLTVKKGGAVNACSNGGYDLVDVVSPPSFFPTSGDGYTCDRVLDTNNEFTACENTCPVCA